jgi:hypothetical protein
MDHSNTWFIPERFSVLPNVLRSLSSTHWEDVGSHALLSVVVATFWYMTSSGKFLEGVRFASHFLVSFKLF